MVFTNSYTKAFVTGKVLSHEDNLLVFEADFSEKLYGLKKNQKIDYISFSDGNECTTQDALVEKVEDSLITLRIEYEKR